MKERAARIATSRREQVTPRARTFSQAPQAVRSARSRRRPGCFPFAAGAGRTLHADKRDALGFTLDVHGLGKISGTAAARAAFRIHSSPSVASQFFTNLRRQCDKVNPVTKPEQVQRSPAADHGRERAMGELESEQAVQALRSTQAVARGRRRKSCVKLMKTARRRGGRVAECGGLLNRCTG